MSRGEMEADIRAGRYLEHGEYEGNLYGTRIDSIRGVVAAGKVCVLDVNPQVPPQPAQYPPWVLCCPPARPGTGLPNTPIYLPITARDPAHLESLSHPPRPPPSLASASFPGPSHLPAVPLPCVPRYHFSTLPGTCPPSYLSSTFQDVPRDVLPHPLLFLQAVKVLRTAEFVPYVVFIEAPDYETLRSMNRAALESGVSTKQLTVRTLTCGGRGLMAAWGEGKAGWSDEEKKVELGQGRGPHPRYR